MADRNTRVYPPIDGSVLLPGVIDFNLQHNYPHSFFVWAKEEPEDGVDVITQGEFSRACHRVAHIVAPPGGSIRQEVVAILGNIDTILYAALVGGLVRAGMVPFPMSPRNSSRATLSMLRSTGCHRVLVSRHSVFDLINGIEQELVGNSYSVSFEDIPPLVTVYPKLAQETANDPFEPYPVNEISPALDDVCLYLHSSGSTANPRAIAQTHRIILLWEHFRITGAIESREHNPPLRFASYVLPPFHIAGLTSQLLQPLFLVYGVSVFPPTSYENSKFAPMTPTNATFLSQAIRSNANAISVVPSFLENWMEDQASLEWLRSLQLVMTLGAALSHEKGNDLVAAGVTLSNPYGATEIGGPVYIFPRKQDLLDGDWDWFRFSERVTPRWIPQGDGLFELQMLTTDTHQVGVENLEDVRGYATNDLFEKHPTKPDLFRVRGRLDDVVVLSAGEKTVPGAMEDLICLSPEVKSAIIFGTGRSQVGLIVEPKPGRVIIPSNWTAIESYKEEIWPFIESANAMGPNFSRIFKEMVIITEPSRPLPRSAKGSVIRKLSLNLYAKEINEVYNDLEPNTSPRLSHSITFPETWDGYELLKWVTEEASCVHNGKIFDTEVDLFSQGFDSLGALFLRNRIVAAMQVSALETVRNSSAKISQNFVYEFPKLSQLSKALSDNIYVPFSRSSASAGVADREAAIAEKISKHIEGIRARDSVATSFVPSDVIVLLTGSTGSIGSFLLAELLRSTLVKKVYALNRCSDLDKTTSRSRQRASFLERGLDISLLESSRCKFLEADISQQNFGLPISMYEELLGSVSAIIHNGWRVDFNLPILYFESNLAATRALIEFSNIALRTPRIIFSSSVSANGIGQGLKQEHKLNSRNLFESTGYGESKYVAERMLSLSGLDICSLRIGQVSGSTSNGAWPTSNWVPIIIKSSIRLGYLPDLNQYINWIPVEKVSKVVLEILFQEGDLFPCLEVVHPKPISWTSMIEAVSEALEKNSVCQKLPLVPWADWITKVEELGSNQLDEDLIQSLPALKILNFLRQFYGSKLSADLAEDCNAIGRNSSPPSCDTTQKFSKTLQDMNSLTAADIELWIQFWKLKGLF